MNEKELILEFLADLNSYKPIYTIIKKWEERLSDATDISEFVNDLNDIETWDEIPWESYKQIDELKKKWEEKL